MTDAQRKHHKLQVKERHSKGGSLTSLLLKLFNWNRWLQKKGIPKKLPSAEWSQFSNTGSQDEGLYMLPRLVTSPGEEDENSAAITRRKDPYCLVHAMPTEDANNSQKPGVVARLMGLDYIPCSSSQKVNGEEAHSQGIPTVTPTGKMQHLNLRDVNLTAKVIEKSSKGAVMRKQLQQRQLARSLDMNLQKISKNSFLSYASKPLLQKDMKKISASPQSSVPRPAKSVSKSGSTQKNTQSKRAALLLEAAVKTLEPSLRSGNPNRPVLVRALVSRTISSSGDKYMSMERSNNGKVCQVHATGGVPEKDPGTISSVQSLSHRKISRSQMSGAAPHRETQKLKSPAIEATQALSDQFHQNEVNASVMNKGHHGKCRPYTPHNIRETKTKAENGLFPTSELHSQNLHDEVEKAIHETDDRLLRTVATENSIVSGKSNNANTKLSQTQHEDKGQTPGLIHLMTEQKCQKAEACSSENLSSCLRNTSPAKEKLPGKITQQGINRSQRKTCAREAGTTQEKPPARRALADFSQQRNQNFSNTKLKSLSKTSTGKSLQKSHDLILTLDKLPSTLATCTDRSLSLKKNQLAAGQESVVDISLPLSTHLEETWKVYEVDERSTEGACDGSSSEGHCVYGDIDLLSCECGDFVRKPFEAVLLKITKEQSPQNSQVLDLEIQLDTQNYLCGTHEDRELPNGKVMGYALKDDHLEDILKSMLSMTIANISSDKEKPQDDDAHSPKNNLKDFIACSNAFGGLTENNRPEEARAPSITLESKSNSPSDNAVTTPRCSEVVFKPDYIEDTGQPSPVSVLELPFGDEDRYPWTGEGDYITTAEDELHACPMPETTDKTISPRMCNRNLLFHSYFGIGETIREAILQNLKNQFIYLFPGEDKENNEMEGMQYKATEASGHIRMSMVQHQQLHHVAMDETGMNKEGFLSKTLDASSKLLSDCAKEVLTHRLSFLRYSDVWSQPSYVELTDLGEQIVDDAFKQINIWSQLNLSTLNDLVDKDLDIPAENWTDFQSSIRDTGAKLECIIFRELLDELVFT